MSSGCKPVDLLDCLLTGRELQKLRVSSGHRHGSSLLSMKLRYVIERAWFTCLEVPGRDDIDEEECWRDQQRFMYLRLRRLVGSANEHHLEAVHHERERVMTEATGDILLPPRNLACSTYSGC